MIIVQARGSKAWEVELLDMRDGSRTGELLHKTSYQLRKITKDDRFPGDVSRAPHRPAAGARQVQQQQGQQLPQTTTTTHVATQEQQPQQREQDQHEQEMEASSNAQQVLLVTTPSGANEENENLTAIEVVVGARRQRQRPQQPNGNSLQQQQPQPQEHAAVTSENNGEEEEGFEVEPLVNNNQQQRAEEREDENNNDLQVAVTGGPETQRQQAPAQPAINNNNRPTQSMDDDNSSAGDTVHPAVQTAVDGNQRAVETILSDGSLSSNSQSIHGIGETGQTQQNTNNEDDVSDVSLDDYFNDTEDFPFLFSDDDDAIDPNSLALANEIESGQEHRRRYERYITRKNQLIDENWTVDIAASTENCIEIGDRVRENKQHNPRFGVVTGKHPDSVPGTPLWNVLFDGDDEETLGLTGRNDLRKIHDNRVFKWQIVDGDIAPDNPVEEFGQVGVIGFDFHKSFSASNLSTINQQYDFPFMRLLIHLWPGNSLIVECPKSLPQMVIVVVSHVVLLLVDRELERSA